MTKSAIIMMFLCCAAMPSLSYAQCTTPECSQIKIIPRAAEEAARQACLNATSGNAEKACTFWVSTAVCSMTYREHLSDIQKLHSDSEMQRYRVKALQNMPDQCDPMSEINLRLEVLENDLSLGAPILSKAERRPHWIQVIRRSGKLHIGPQLLPVQRQEVAYHLVFSPDFEELKTEKEVREFLALCRDESVDLLPEISKTTTEYLRQLEQTVPDLMTSGAQMVLILDEIHSGQYSSVRDRLKTLDMSALSEENKKHLIPQIQKYSTSLIERRDFRDTICIEELKEKDKSQESDKMLAFYGAIVHPSDESAIYVLQSATPLRLSRCEYESICKQFADIWQNQYAKSDVQNYAEMLLLNLENHPNPEFTRLLVQALESISGDALIHFRDKYGTRLGKLALSKAEFDFSYKAYESASHLLSGAIRIIPEARACDARLLYGRVLDLLHQPTMARQQWGMIIDKGQKSECQALAYYLSILSFRRDGRKVEADTLYSQFYNQLPSSMWLQKLIAEHQKKN